MSKLSLLLITLYVGVISAFAPISNNINVQTRSPFVNIVAAENAAFTTTSLLAEDMSWEGEYPPSKVLGPIMSKMPSRVLGGLSLVFAFACVYSIAGSAVLQQEPDALKDGSWIRWYYILGSFGGPFAWGTHVACWIQRQNGM